MTTTSLAPVLWGTTYLVTTSFLPAGHPLFVATLRALPAGLVLLLITRRRPVGAWWWRALVLGALNIAAFFAFLFVAADRLPGGVAAVVGGVQPLLVALLASRLLRERLTIGTVLAGLVGVVGVALIVLRATARLDAVGVAAACGGAVSMAVGVVLARRWSDGVPPLVMTAWQLVAGGVLLAAATVVVEPLPARPFDGLAVPAFAYLSLVGTAFAYSVWFRGLSRLPARVPAFLGLLSPMVALVLGLVVAGESLSGLQGVGVALVLGAVLATVLGRRH